MPRSSAPGPPDAALAGVAIAPSGAAPLSAEDAADQLDGTDKFPMLPACPTLADTGAPPPRPTPPQVPPMAPGGGSAPPSAGLGAGAPGIWPAAHAVVKFIVPIGKYGQLVQAFAKPWFAKEGSPSTEAINPVGPRMSNPFGPRMSCNDGNDDVADVVAPTDVVAPADVDCVTAWDAVPAVASCEVSDAAVWAELPAGVLVAWLTAMACSASPAASVVRAGSINGGTAEATAEAAAYPYMAAAS